MPNQETTLDHETVLTEDEILQKLAPEIAVSLGIDTQKVTMNAELIGDLGADSADLLDIEFRVRGAFEYAFDTAGLFPGSDLFRDDLVDDGVLNAGGLEELKKVLPHANTGEFESDPSIARLSSLFTVAFLVRFVRNKLEAATLA